MFCDKLKRIAKPNCKNSNKFVGWISLGYYIKIKSVQNHENKRSKILKLPI